MATERYHREEWVQGQIENWVGYSPTNAGRAMAMVEELGQLIDLNRAHTQIPRDATSAERTSRAFDALTPQQRTALMLYHTKRTLSLRQIGSAMKVSKDTARRALQNGHIAFVDAWDQAKYSAQRAETERLKQRASAGVCENVR